MQPLTLHEGIEGLNGREPVDAVLTIGEKGPRGNPTNTDRFFIKSPHEEKRGEIGVRPPHPSFGSFNGAAVEHRQSIRGVLVHAEQADCFSYRLTMPKAPKGGRWSNHPNGMPFCTGDGKRATRLYAIGTNGQPDDWREIECPNKACEFRLGDSKLCKPFGRLYFRPVWSEKSSLPTPLMKFETHAWNTVANMLGFFEYVEGVAKGLGLPGYTLFGMPFTLTLHRKTKPSQQRSFPVVKMAPAFDPVTFFMAQRKNIELAGGRPMLQLVGARSPEEQEPAAVAASLRELSGEPPTIPAETPAPAIDVESTVVEEADDEWPEPKVVPAHVRRVLSAGSSAGMTPEQVTSLLGADVFSLPADLETEALRKLKALRVRK